MTKDNILTTVSLSISPNSTDEVVLAQVTSFLTDYDKVYSYIVKVKYKDETPIAILVNCNISQTDKYNTLKSAVCIEEIYNIIVTNRSTTKSVIGYKQPDIELMLKLFNPLVHKLALEQCDRWSELEYEDAVSMCKLVMCNLYVKGYYIHRFLLKRSFENYVLMQLRHSRDKPEVLSFEQVMHGDGEHGLITLGDMLPDRDAEIEAEKKEEDEVFEVIFNEVKEIIVELIGERQFEQLLRDYGNKHTTTWSRKKMQQIKNKFNKLGISWKSFER